MIDKVVLDGSGLLTQHTRIQHTNADDVCPNCICTTVMKKFEKRVVSWAETQARVRAIFVVGSRARREDHPADEWADLDLMLFCTDFDIYLADTKWLAAIGEVWACIPSRTGDGDPERLVLFDGGSKVDFVFYSLNELQRLVEIDSLPEVYQRGYYIIVDKDRIARKMLPPGYEASTYEPPLEEEFRRIVDAFWYGALYVAKQIRRRNLWIVKFRDWTMKEQLLEMMVWHARGTDGWDHDTWHNGKYLPEWADAHTLDALQDVFGYFDASDSWRALIATMNLFRRLATKTAVSFDFSYPVKLDDRVTQLVQTLYRNDKQ